MNQMVARLNVAYLHKQIAIETDEAKRQLLLRMLAEEETRLSAPISRAK